MLPKSKKTVNKVEKPQTGNFRPLTPEFLAYFASRGISEKTLKRNQVAQESTWMPGQPTGDAIAFPYLRNGEVVNVKYRTMNKCFRQVKGAEKILYGLDDVVGQDTIIIVEGESSLSTARKPLTIACACSATSKTRWLNTLQHNMPMCLLPSRRSHSAVHSAPTHENEQASIGKCCVHKHADMPRFCALCTHR